MPKREKKGFRKEEVEKKISFESYGINIYFKKQKNKIAEK